MKKLLLVLFLTLFTATANFAQSMSDEAVMEYVKDGVKQGKTQKQLYQELLIKGVTKEQLLRIKEKYEQQQSEAKTIKGNADVDTQRVNPEKRDDIASAQDDNKQQAAPEGGIQVFGRDIFRNSDLTFEPSMNIATPTDYRLGPGDQVVIEVWGASEANITQKVTPDGYISIPDIGPVAVNGLTVQAASERIRGKLSKIYSGMKTANVDLSTNVKVSLGQIRTIQVNIMGEVARPGTYALSSFSTVFHALYKAGGISELGSLRNIKVVRGGRTVATVDVYDYIINGRSHSDIRLQEGDVILASPYDALVLIQGKIKRPMYYEMKKNESLQSLLKYAGGFTGDAYKQKVRVERKSDDGLTVHNVDEWDFTTFACEDGDIAVVSPVIERYRNTVTITGAVFREGQYKLGGNVNTVKTLVDQAGGLKEQAFTTRAVLHRMREDRTLNSMTINLKGILDGSAPDVVLQNEDELIISSTEEITSKQSLTIYGDVVMPGVYKYSDGETLEDLITEAGGLLESASLLNVEVARRIMSADDNPDGKKMAKIYQATLAEGLAIEGETGLKLRPYDIVTIHRSPNYQEQKVVNISGEVLYGGSYVLSDKEERITDILKRAGGMTKNAYVDGVQLIRKVSKKELDIQRMKLEVAKNMADSLEIMSALQKTSYSVGIDLRKALDNPGSGNDIIMHEGDSIYIPQLNNVVKISGEVMFPNTIAYEKDRKASYYINQAGGLTKKAKRKLAYIVYPNGQVSRLSKGKILPGCEVVVPTPPEKKIDTNRTSLFMALASSVATIAAVLITALK